jgi:hypothetical protein
MIIFYHTYWVLYVLTLVIPYPTLKCYLEDEEEMNYFDDEFS